MEKRRGFFLTDTLMALLIIALGSTAVLAMMRRCAALQLTHRHFTTANEVLSLLETQTLERLATADGRGFDVRGQPAANAPAFFTLEVRLQEEGHLVEVQGQVRFRDGDDEARMLSFSRRFWHGG